MRVTLTELGTQKVYETTTENDGAFRFTNIPPGQYLLHVETTGFHADHDEAITVTSAGTAFNTTLTLLKNGSFHFELKRLLVEGNIGFRSNGRPVFTSDFTKLDPLLCSAPVTLKNGKLVLTDTDGHARSPQGDGSLFFGDACLLSGTNYDIRAGRGHAAITATFLATEPTTNTHYHMSLLTRLTEKQIFLLVANDGEGTMLLFYTVGPHFTSIRMLEQIPLDLSNTSLLHLMLEYDDAWKTVSAGYRIDGKDDDPFIILKAQASNTLFIEGNEAVVGIGAASRVPSD